MLPAMRAPWLLIALATLSFQACSKDEPLPADGSVSGMDAATAADSGSGNDAAAQVDAGTGADANAADDATAAADAGMGADALPAADAAPGMDAGMGADAAPAADAAPGADTGAGADAGANAPPGPGERAIGRGGLYFGTPERFNRYYTDPSWTALATIYVSPNGTGNGNSSATPSSVTAGLARAQAGTKVVFLAGAYAGCYELDSTQSGTYDQPIVLQAERGAGGGRGVTIDCCNSGRQTCINLEAANYVAVEGFELRGGRYGVRGVGELTGSGTTHQKGLAVLDCYGHDQNNDPFFTGQSDWVVLDHLLATGAGAGDGHGIYMSNGSDYLIARNIELHSNASSDFQINADPAFGCTDQGIPLNDPRCDGPAAMGQGEGVSEYVTVEYNYFHHGNAQGPNFTSVRNSIVRNNFFGFYARHGVSFWQETDNPRLGSSDNQILHNLFIATSNRQALQFVVDSDRNLVANNLFLGLNVNGNSASANPNALLLEIDNSVGNNVWIGNTWVSGQLSGRTPNAREIVISTFDPAWFTGFGVTVTTPVGGFHPRGAPLAGAVPRIPSVPIDFTGAARSDPTASGPFEAQ